MAPSFVALPTGKTKLLGSFVLAGTFTMKSSPLLLFPLAAVLFSGCAGPGGPTYVDYGPGPDPRAGYYWNGTIYVEGENPYYQHRGEYNRDTTNVNDTSINRTTVNDRTINNTQVNDRTVNNRKLNKRTVNQPNAGQANAANPKMDDRKRTRKPNPGDQTNPQQGNQ
jgi:hypothetical protein